MVECVSCSKKVEFAYRLDDKIQVYCFDCFAEILQQQVWQFEEFHGQCAEEESAACSKKKIGQLTKFLCENHEYLELITPDGCTILWQNS